MGSGNLARLQVQLSFPPSWLAELMGPVTLLAGTHQADEESVNGVQVEGGPLGLIHCGLSLSFVGFVCLSGTLEVHHDEEFRYCGDGSVRDSVTSH